MDNKSNSTQNLISNEVEKEEKSGKNFGYID